MPPAALHLATQAAGSHHHVERLGQDWALFGPCDVGTVTLLGCGQQRNDHAR
jgi:hypothetical protein